MQVPSEHVRIGKVVGENEDGITLFFPKSMTDGSFTLSDNPEENKFLTAIFVHQVDGAAVTWLPWENA